MTTTTLPRRSASTNAGVVFGPTRRSPDVDPPTLEALAAALATSCARRLGAIAHRGGPSASDHVEELRRLLVRREGRRAGLGRRRQIRHAVDAAASGHPGPVPAGDRHALVRDLRELERALVPAARVGGSAPEG